MSELARWAWLSGFDGPWIAFWSGVALLVLMMVSSAALLLREMLEAAVGREQARATWLSARDRHACEASLGDVGPGPGASTTDPEARC